MPFVCGLCSQYIVHCRSNNIFISIISWWKKYGSSHQLYCCGDMLGWWYDIVFRKCNCRWITWLCFFSFPSIKDFVLFFPIPSRKGKTGKKTLLHLRVYVGFYVTTIYFLFVFVFIFSFFVLYVHRLIYYQRDSKFGFIWLKTKKQWGISFFHYWLWLTSEEK